MRALYRHHDLGVFLIDLHLIGSAQLCKGGILQFQTQFTGNHFGTGQGGNILQHILPTVAKARSLHGYAVEGAAQFVQNQSC